MGPLEHLSDLSLPDGIAVLLLISSWFILGWMIEHASVERPSVTVIMADYRRAWMRQMVTREPRIFDASILANLRQGTAFFASGCMIAIGGVLAVIGNSQTLKEVASDLAVADGSTFLWQVKLLLVVLFLTHGFLKFVWANRLFGYCAVVMASVPNETSAPLAYPRAKQAAEINIRAAWNFNRGLRAIYYALGTLAWVGGPWALIIANVLVVWLIWYREFASQARSIVLEGWPDDVVSEPSEK
jgi:uncharacterized membrane protein